MLMALRGLTWDVLQTNAFYSERSPSVIAKHSECGVNFSNILPEKVTSYKTEIIFKICNIWFVDRSYIVQI